MIWSTSSPVRSQDWPHSSRRSTAGRSMPTRLRPVLCADTLVHPASPTSTAEQVSPMLLRPEAQPVVQGGRRRASTCGRSPRTGAPRTGQSIAASSRVAHATSLGTEASLEEERLMVDRSKKHVSSVEGRDGAPHTAGGAELAQGRAWNGPAMKPGVKVQHATVPPGLTIRVISFHQDG